MKSKYLPFILFTVMGCSTTINNEQDKSLERINISQKSYSRPDFYIGDIQNISAGRSIASVDNTKSINNRESEKFAKLSNRQVYFLAMYKQYKELSHVLGLDAQISSCPSFHNVILDNSESLKLSDSQLSKNIELSYVKEDPKLLSSYPVMALPYSSDQDLYTKLVNSEFTDSKVYLDVALGNYHQTQKREVEVLCDKGVSAGYYIYENLVTYFKSDNSLHSSVEGLKALLKVPVIANMVILDNMNNDDYTFNQSSILEDGLLERSKSTWFKKYLLNLNRSRKSKISKMMLGY